MLNLIYLRSGNVYNVLDICKEPRKLLELVRIICICLCNEICPNQLLHVETYVHDNCKYCSSPLSPRGLLIGLKLYETGTIVYKFVQSVSDFIICMILIICRSTNSCSRTRFRCHLESNLDHST